MNHESQARYLNLISGRARGPLASLARAMLGAASIPYCVGAFARSKAFDTGLIASEKVDGTVISVGNVTTGGTGKTPMVEYVARHIRNRGLRVTIVSRGYGSGPDGGMNDEGLLLDANLTDVPHLQGPDRASLARVAIDELEAQVILLDDGHQHRHLARDLNIVLIDATNPFGYGWTLPRGLLREPLATGLRRADVVVLTRSDLVTPAERTRIRNKIARFTPHGMIWCEGVHRPLDLIDAAGSSLKPETIAGKNVVLFCGLGNPEAFRSTIANLGATVIDVRWFPDHHLYSQNDLAELSRWVAASGADLVLTTQKDSVKLPVESLGGRPLLALRIGMAFEHGEADFLGALDNLLNACPSSDGAP